LAECGFATARPPTPYIYYLFSLFPSSFGILLPFSLPHHLLFSHAPTIFLFTPFQHLASLHRHICTVCYQFITNLTKIKPFTSSTSRILSLREAKKSCSGPPLISTKKVRI